MDHLAGLHIHDHQLLIVLAGNKQVLVFQIVAEVIDITFGGDRDRLHKPQKARPVLHGRLLIDVGLRLLLSSRAQNEDRAYTQDDERAQTQGDRHLFHFLSPQIGYFRFSIWLAAKSLTTKLASTQAESDGSEFA